MSFSFSSALSGLFIGAGIAAAGYFGSNILLNKETGMDTAVVKGLSERVLPADEAIWILGVTTRENDFSQYERAFANAGQAVQRINDKLLENGITPDEILANPLTREDHIIRNSDREVVDSYFVVKASVTVNTAEPEKISMARGPVLGIGAEGMNIFEKRLSYNFKSLNEVKPDMLREATQNARIAANEFASNAGVEVGGIKSARQGGFEIYPDSADPVQQHIRVVTNITFYLDN